MNDEKQLGDKEDNGSAVKITNQDSICVICLSELSYKSFEAQV